MGLTITLASRERQRPESGRDDVALDFRQRYALEARERETRRQLDQAEQCSAQNSSEVRIRAWEKVHQLRMPSTPLHPVLEAIALATQLTLDEVRREQQLRYPVRVS